MARELQGVLEQGSGCADTKAAHSCANLLALYPALWLFATLEGVEPTNNHAERILRRGVLSRKNAFGCHSTAGCRFVERMLTVTQTLRLQGRPVLDYLVRAIEAHRSRPAGSAIIGPGWGLNRYRPCFALACFAPAASLFRASCVLVPRFRSTEELAASLFRAAAPTPGGGRGQWGLTRARAATREGVCPWSFPDRRLLPREPQSQRGDRPAVMSLAVIPIAKPRSGATGLWPDGASRSSRARRARRRRGLGASSGSR